MSTFVRWDSQPLDSWSERYAQGKFIDLAGRRTHYLEKGEGQPVILLHGFFYDSYMWATNLDALAQNFKVYALDLWGFGYSTREPLEYSYELYVEQVLLFMDSLGIEKASIIGQSMGGGTAILFCLKHRERVNKLVLVAPAGLPNPLALAGKIFTFSGVGELLLNVSTDFIRRKILGYFWIYNQRLLTDSYCAHVTRFHKISGTTRVLLTILRQQFFDTLSHEISQLAQLEVPILIVWGQEDNGVPVSCGQEMHRILNGSRFEIFADVGHVPNYEKTEEFNQLTLDFLKESSHDTA